MSNCLSPADYLYRSLSQLRLVQCLLHLASQSDDGLSGEELADLADSAKCLGVDIASPFWQAKSKCLRTPERRLPTRKRGVFMSLAKKKRRIICGHLAGSGLIKHLFAGNMPAALSRFLAPGLFASCETIRKRERCLMSSSLLLPDLLDRARSQIHVVRQLLNLTEKHQLEADCLHEMAAVLDAALENIDHVFDELPEDEVDVTVEVRHAQ